MKSCKTFLHKIKFQLFKQSKTQNNVVLEAYILLLNKSLEIHELNKTKSLKNNLLL